MSGPQPTFMFSRLPRHQTMQQQITDLPCNIEQNMNFFLLGCERRASGRSSTDDKNLTEKKTKYFSFFSFPALSGFPFNKGENSPICASLFRQAPHMKLWGDKKEKKIPTIVHFTAFSKRDALSSFFFV